MISTESSPSCRPETGWRPAILRLWPHTILLVLVAAAYANAFSGVWQFDDNVFIWGKAGVTRLWPPVYLTGNTRPVVFLTLALNRFISGRAIWSFHLFNIGIHAASAMLLYAVVRLALARKTDRAGVCWAALAVASLWAVHPIHTMAVTYVWQRCESLMGFFYLLTIYCFHRSALAPRPRRWQLLCLLSCAAGMASKEPMVTAPVLLLLYDRSLLGGSWLVALQKRGRLYAALAATWCIPAVLLFFFSGAFHTSQGVGFGSSLFTPLDYARAMIGAHTHYLRLAFWPQPLCFDYGADITRDTTISAGPFLLISTLLIITIWGVWKNRKWALPLAAYWVTMAVTSSFFPMPDPIVEYRLYLPLGAIFALVVPSLQAARKYPNATKTNKGTGFRLKALLIVAATILLLTLTVRRNREYHSPLALWSHTCTVRPQNPLAWAWLGTAYMGEEEFALAEAAFRKALTLLRQEIERASYLAQHRGQALVIDDVGFQANIGYCLLRQGRFSEAVLVLEDVVRRRPHQTTYLGWLGISYEQTGRLEQARACFERMAELNPEDGSTKKLLHRLPQSTHPDM